MVELADFLAVFGAERALLVVLGLEMVRDSIGTFWTFIRMSTRSRRGPERRFS